MVEITVFFKVSLVCTRSNSGLIIQFYGFDWLTTVVKRFLNADQKIASIWLVSDSKDITAKINQCVFYAFAFQIFL